MGDPYAILLGGPTGVSSAARSLALPGDRPAGPGPSSSNDDKTTSRDSYPWVPRGVRSPLRPKPSSLLCWEAGAAEWCWAGLPRTHVPDVITHQFGQDVPQGHASSRDRRHRGVEASRVCVRGTSRTLARRTRQLRDCHEHGPPGTPDSSARLVLGQHLDRLGDPTGPRLGLLRPFDPQDVGTLVRVREPLEVGSRLRCRSQGC